MPCVSLSHQKEGLRRKDTHVMLSSCLVDLAVARVSIPLVGERKIALLRTYLHSLL